MQTKGSNDTQYHELYCMSNNHVIYLSLKYLRVYKEFAIEFKMRHIKANNSFHNN